MSWPKEIVKITKELHKALVATVIEIPSLFKLLTMAAWLMPHNST